MVNNLQPTDQLENYDADISAEISLLDIVTVLQETWKKLAAAFFFILLVLLGRRLWLVVKSGGAK